MAYTCCRSTVEVWRCGHTYEHPLQCQWTFPAGGASQSLCTHSLSYRLTCDSVPYYNAPRTHRPRRTLRGLPTWGRRFAVSWRGASASASGRKPRACYASSKSTGECSQSLSCRPKEGSGCSQSLSYRPKEGNGGRSVERSNPKLEVFILIS